MDKKDFLLLGKIITLAFSAILLGNIVRSHKKNKQTSVVPHVDLARYMGTWYEIARIPKWFERGCVASKAEYTLLPSGRVAVVNECRKSDLNGKIKRVQGKARVVDSNTNARLRVRFFWPFSGDYWIIELDEAYRYAAVSGPSKNSLWILSRSRQMDEGDYRDLLQRLQTRGYDLYKLVKTLQPS